MDVDKAIEILGRKKFKKIDGQLRLKQLPYDKTELALYMHKKGVHHDLEWCVNNAEQVIINFPESILAEEIADDIIGWCQNYFKLKGLTFNYNETVTNGVGKTVRMDMFLAQIKNDAYRAGLKNYKDIIDNCLTLAQGAGRLDYISQKNAELAYDPNATDHSINFIDAISARPEMNKYHVAVLKHWIWQIKRKMLELPIEYHMMINWYGPSNSGKTRSIQALCLPLEDATYDANNLSIIKDDRFGSILQNHPIIMIDELAGADKVTAEELKRAITTPNWNYRILGTNSHNQGRNMATFVSTSNLHINSMIVDPKSARRYWQVDCKERDELKKFWSVIDKIDYKGLWKSVDENSLSPIMPLLDEILEIQNKELKAESPMQMFLREKYHVDPSKDGEKFPHKLEQRQLEDAFRQWVDDTGIYSKKQSQFIKNEVTDLGHEFRKDKRPYFIIYTQLGFTGLQEIENETI